MVEILGIIFLILIFVLSKKAKEYSNPFKLIMIIGKKGVGKTTDICKLNMFYRQLGWTTYCTEPVPDSYQVDPSNIGYVEFEKNSVLFIDEIGIIWHSRDFKKFAKEVREWFKLQRHRHIIVYCYSQSFDIDKSLRDLCDEIWIAKKLFGIFTVKKKVIKEIGIVQATAEGESRFVDNLKLVPWFIPGSRKFTYIPKYARYFDSFAAPKLTKMEFKYNPEKVYKLHFWVQLHLIGVELKRITRRLHTKWLTFRYKKGWLKGL